MPHALELPRVRRPVVPLVRAWNAGVHELVVDRLPSFPAVVGSLDLLAEPAAGLRRVQAIRIRGRTLDVINLPAAKERPVDVPSLALSVRGQHERALPRAYEYPHSAHRSSFPHRGAQSRTMSSGSHCR